MVVLLLLILGLFYGFGTSQVETGVTSAAPATRVPNVAGLAPASAARRIRQAGLGTEMDSSASRLAPVAARPRLALGLNVDRADRGLQIRPPPP